ncbi:MAG TPA: sensor domain-containing diguanylate cyclase [Rhodanobacter sp.]|nr:sensor domain-containing diguanylate cyclase [Rhodanobacter sp.]
MTQSTAGDGHQENSIAPWDERDASSRHGMLTEILAQVSIEALQGDTLEAVLQRIVDCVGRRLPVAITSIILLNDACTHFVQEVWSGKLDLELPTELPWPVALGAAGRCVKSGTALLITDVDADPDYVAGNRAVRSEYLVPIRHRARLHGVLNLESAAVDFFTPEVCATFDAIAVQIAGAVHLARVVAELEQANCKLERLSMSDGLTGIANRRCFDRQLEELWQQRNGESLALLLADVDCFKALNDARGHVFGDECLRTLAGLCAEMGDAASALVARYGGEEFVLLVPGADLHDAQCLAERLCRGVESLSIAHPDSPVAAHVTISIGVSVMHPDDQRSSQSLVMAADHALYAAKAAGRNRVVALG